MIERVTVGDGHEDIHFAIPVPKPPKGDASNHDGHVASFAPARASKRVRLFPQGGTTMARAGSHILDRGDRFPPLAFDTVQHGRVTLPDHFAGCWGVVLLYRAHW